MTTENSINAVLLTAGVALTTQGVALLPTNWPVSLALIIAGLVVFGVREILP
jgi:hypothetical protein